MLGHQMVTADQTPDPAYLTNALVHAGVEVLVVRGAVPDAGASTAKSLQVLIPRRQVASARAALEPLGWRYSWVRGGIMRLLPMLYYWWDGGYEIEAYWSLPAAPLPSGSLKALKNELWRSATRTSSGVLQPHADALLVHFAVQSCRPGPGHEPDWESFLRLRASTPDLEPAVTLARRVGVSRGLRRALASADAGGGPPGTGRMFDGPMDWAWRGALALQSQARPRRFKRLLAGMPSLGDALIRCRTKGVEALAGPGVFVPTPDADIFVAMSEELLAGATTPTVVEIGTGCGAIALAVAHARPDAEVHGTDLFRVATRWAERSARGAGLDRVRFHTGSLLDPLPADLHRRVDLVIANLPFYPPSGYAAIGSVPRETIQGQADDGLGLVRQLAHEAPAFLRSGGTLLLQMFAWQWDKLVEELPLLGYTPATPRYSGRFAICPAKYGASAG